MSLWNRRRTGPLYLPGSNSSRLQKRRKKAAKQFPVFTGRRLQIERLEDRYVLSVATVNTALDVVDLSDSVTSLREALFFTNTLIGHDTIQFDASLAGQSIKLTLGELTIKDSLTINGLGQNVLTIDASGNDPTSSTDNGDGSRIFNIDDGNDLNVLDVSISGLTLLGGDVTGNGGAILNSESLGLSDATVKENSATQGGGIFSAAAGSISIARSSISTNRASYGAGVYSVGVDATIDSSTISGNVASESGGGLYSESDLLEVTNSTFSGNTAKAGGGIYVATSVDGVTQISHSTITANRAQSGGGITFITASDAVHLDHTIVAANLKPTGSIQDDIAGSVHARFSLVGTVSGASIVNDGGNQVGTVVAPINPLLGPLANNGGPTLTHALLLTSPAIDAGDPAFDPGVDGPAYDQRGIPFDRDDNGKGTGNQIDIGAYEVQTGSIQGRKWNDLNGDGVWQQPAEPALAGWLIYLDANHNGALDNGEASTFTDAGGNYTFTDLAPGNYSVAEIKTPGWTQTSPGEPQPTSLIVNGNFETGSLTGWTVQNTGTGGFVINNGSVDPTSPDGPMPPLAGSYSALSNGTSGTFAMYQDVIIPAGSNLTLQWTDRIRNHYTSFVDPNQEYRVEIRNQANQVLGIAFSTNPGDPLFRESTERSADLSAYAGQLIRIAFVTQTTSNYMNVHVDNVRIVIGSGNGSIAVSVGDGQLVQAVNFGNWQVPTGEIHGAKWNDLNGNGVWEHGNEPALAGWTIFLDANHNGGLDTGEPWTTTGADGSYAFTGLAPGSYLVAELLQPGWAQTSPGPLSTSGLIVNGDFETGSLSGWTQENVGGTGSFAINNGTLNPTGNDGPLPPYQGSYSALSNATTGTHSIYQDVAIPVGSHLRLQWADRIRNQSTTFTDPTQEYRVEIRTTTNQLLQVVFSTNPGDPQFREWTERAADLSSYAGQTVRIAFVEQNSTTNLNIHVDNVRLTSTDPIGAIPITLTPGQIVSNVNFGNRVLPPAEIRGFKWNDLNGDGVWQQGAEPPLAGLTVYIDTNTNGALDFDDVWTTTAADGSYSFTSLAPGDYVVSDVVTPGWTRSYPTGQVVVGRERLFELRVNGTTLTISEINPTTGAILNSFNAPGTTTSINIQGLAVGPNSLFYVEGSSSSTHTLYELNPDTGAVIDSDIIDSTLSGQIGGLAYLDGKVFIEKDSSNQLIVWDPVSDVAISTLTVAADLNGGLTGAADLHALFASNGNGQIFKINPTTGAVLSTFSTTLGALSFGLAYVNGELIAARSGTTGAASRISPASGAVLGSLTLAGIGTVGALGGEGIGKTVIQGAHLVTLTQSQIVTNVNFGNWIAPPVEIHGSKWNDLNGNGVWDKPTEPGLPGRIIYLDANGNSALDSNELWTLTAADGSYSFTGLPAGEYIVGELQQTGWTPTHPIENHPDSERLFVVRGTSTTTAHTIYELNPATGAVINSFLTPVTGSLGIEGLAVGPHSLFYVNGSGTTQHTMWELDLNTGAVIDADVVDTTVSGVIGGLAYLNGKVYIEKSTSNQLLVWDPVTDSLTATLNIGADVNGGLTGAADLGVLFDFGTSGRIYTINPANGVVLQTLSANVESLSGLAYVQGKLIGSRSGSSSSVYRIDPVTGQVLEQFTMGGTGTNGGLGGDGETRYPRLAHRLTIAPGAVVEKVDFGDWIAPLGQIQGFTWNDLDADHVWDQPAEPGLAGWTIFLDTNANGVLDTGETSTTTAADGSYLFTGLAAGHYVIGEVLQTDWIHSVTPRFVTLDPGEVATNINIGNRLAPGGIQGQKWNDLNGNGVKEEGEPGLPDWTIFIDTDSDGVLDDGEQVTTTDSVGNYSFGDLIPGNYTLAEVKQDGWINSHSPNSIVVAANQVTADADFGNYALPTLPGDFNRNGVVDAADYVLWRHTIGNTPPAYIAADGTGDGTVASDDYDVWRGNFGNPVSSPGNATAAFVTGNSESFAMGSSSSILSTDASESAAQQSVALKKSFHQNITALYSSSATMRADRKSSASAIRISSFADNAGEFERLHDEALLECLSAGLAPDLAVDRDVVEQIRRDFSANADDDMMQASDSLGLEFTNWMAIANSAGRG